jgi:PII interaction protein X
MNTNETYLNHPTFGLLYRVCTIEPNQEIFTTLYAQRLFFLVKANEQGLAFEPKSRSEARLLIENRLRKLRRLGAQEEHSALSENYKRIFQ